MEEEEEETLGGNPSIEEGDAPAIAAVEALEALDGLDLVEREQVVPEAEEEEEAAAEP